MNAAVQTSPEARQKAAQDRLIDDGKRFVLGKVKSNIPFAGVLDTFSEVDDFVNEHGEALGVEADGTSKGRKIWNSIKEAFKPLADLLSWIWDSILDAMGMLDKDSKLAEKAVPQKIAQSGAYKAMATKLGLKEEVGTDIQKILRKSAEDYLKDGIPAFNRDGTQTNTINHVITTHVKIVAYLAGVQGSSVGRLAQQYPDMPPAKRLELAEQMASYVTGLPPQPNDGNDGYDLAQLVRKNDKGQYINISGGLAQTLLTVQALSKGEGQPKNSLREADVPIVFNESSLNAAAALLSPASNGQAAQAAAGARPRTPVTGGTTPAAGSTPAPGTTPPGAAPAAPDAPAAAKK